MTKIEKSAQETIYRQPGQWITFLMKQLLILFTIL